MQRLFLLLLKELNINLAGKNAVVIGRSNIVGKPMAQLLIKESCTVTVAHSKTKDLLPDISFVSLIAEATIPGPVL